MVYVGIVSIQGAGQFQVLERLRETPQVEDVHVVTGPKDLLVMVSSPTDKRSPEGVLDVTHQAGRKDGDHAA